MMHLTIEMIPLFMAMVIVVPLTSEVVRSVLEEKLDFDHLIDRNLLRVVEILIAFMVFPTALVYIICMGAYLLCVEMSLVSIALVNYIKGPRIIENFFYYVSVVSVFLGCLLMVELLLKFIYAAL
ncbi:uncharacterized protein LOC131958302 [Physella acuta]|uniref:uncharacterized protein LOC131958302 n=1 Tax=Physella acuta TaxID=109671 RepID=UPI0027DDED55|nr:uncharacterized protein LOC131958302 [Physella acuta]XP_059179255.1 uncharacterized protein LOC131958302 [Physella acuta]